MPSYEQIDWSENIQVNSKDHHTIDSYEYYVIREDCKTGKKTTEHRLDVSPILFTHMLMSEVARLKSKKWYQFWK